MGTVTNIKPPHLAEAIRTYQRMLKEAGGSRRKLSENLVQSCFDYPLDDTTKTILTDHFEKSMERVSGKLNLGR